MKRVYYIVSFVCALIIGTCMHTYAQKPGSSCTTAIPLGKDYSAPITGEGTVWYSAWTFDLPIKVCFTPGSPDAPAPDVEMDFTCTLGVYEDSILCSLFCDNGSGGIQFDMPHKPKLVKEGDAYCISMGMAYRDLLLKMGISSNVEVYVKVTYHSAGTISLLPDTEFADCMDGGKFMQYGDTVKVNALDTKRHVVLPYIQWQENPLRYTWEGTEPVEVTVSITCDVDPLNGSDERIIDRFTIQPNTSYDITADMVRYFAQYENAQAGMHYGKFYSKSTGVLKVERVPIPAPDGGATLLRYDRTVMVPARDSMALFAMRNDQLTKPTRFSTSTNHIVHMYVGTTADFLPSTAIASYQFSVTEEGHELALVEKQMNALWEKATGIYLYVRFYTTARTNIAVNTWSPSECLGKWGVLPTGELTVARKSKGLTYYRFYYKAWKGQDINLQWASTSIACPVYVADTCSLSPLNKDNAHVVYFVSIPKKGSATITAETIDEWANRVDDEGNLYVLFYNNSTSDAKMTISGGAPEEKDPVYPASSILVECVDGSSDIKVSVSKAQHLTLKNALNTVVKEWDAEIGKSETLTLSAGSYQLVGKDEIIALQIP